MDGQQLSDRAAAAYLEHLGVDATRGEVDAAMLTALGRAHVARVPYENIDIYRGAPPGIEPLACVERVIGGRGGYCFHLNGALITLLEWLQVDVTRHVSGVQGGGREAPGPNGNHLGITARLPDGSEWFVDAGLGDGPVGPAPARLRHLRAVRIHLRAARLDLRPATGGGSSTTRGERSSAPTLPSAPARTEQFLEMHHELSTSPTSGFVRIADVMRRTGAGVEVLRGCMHMTTTSEGTDSVEVDSEADWWGIVIDEFGLRYGDLPPRSGASGDGARRPRGVGRGRR